MKWKEIESVVDNDKISSPSDYSLRTLSRTDDKFPCGSCPKSVYGEIKLKLETQPVVCPYLYSDTSITAHGTKRRLRHFLEVIFWLF